MERISIFNYEAFYLDYLEGNLSERDTQMLLQFLEEHPECRMDDDELVTLNDEAPMTYSGKKNLKQTDESAAIALENVEHFMIADAEGLLSEKKKTELNAIVAENLELEVTRSRYKAVYFAPDESVVFAGKADLKQRKALILWPYLSGVVAVAAVALFMLLPRMNGLSVGPMDLPMLDVAYSPGSTDPKEDSVKVEHQGGTNNNPIKQYAANVVRETTVTPVIKGRSAMKQRKIVKVGDHAVDNTLMPVKTYGDVSDPLPDLQLKPKVYNGVDKTQDQDIVMKNPIAPVTAFIAEKAKTDIDFKRRKASKDKKAGFFVKIGSFEISKNKH